MIDLKKTMIIIIAMMLVFSLSAVVSAAPVTSDLSANERLTILNIPAYSISCERNDSDLYCHEAIDKYLAMSNDDFNKAIISNMQSIVEKKEKGADIKWNPRIVEVVKPISPKLAGEIAKQVESDSQAKPVINVNHINQATTLRLTPGSDNRTWVIYDVNMGNIKLYGFFANISWSWDSSKITSVNSTAYDEIYAPLWSYCGATEINPHYIDSSHVSYYTYWRGHFQTGIGYPLTNTYPWHEILVRAGGGTAHSTGF